MPSKTLKTAQTTRIQLKPCWIVIHIHLIGKKWNLTPSRNLFSGFLEFLLSILFPPFCSSAPELPSTSPLWAPICASPAPVRQPAIACEGFPFCTVGYSEHASSRMLAGTIIGLILIFPFSQPSQSGTACCLTLRKQLFNLSCTVFSNDFWKGISDSCYCIVAENRNRLCYTWLSSERMRQWRKHSEICTGRPWVFPHFKTCRD